MEGDDQHLPYLGQLSVLGLEEHEQFLVDSEDLTSCVNLSGCPASGLGSFAFQKGGWQSFWLGPWRTGLCGTDRGPNGLDQFSSCHPERCEAACVWTQWGPPESSEVSKLKRFPDEDSISLVYLDSFDEIRRMDRIYAEVVEGKMSERHQAFIDSCNRLKLPLNEGKRLVGAVRGTMQGAFWMVIEACLQLVLTSCRV